MSIQAQANRPHNVVYRTSGTATAFSPTATTASVSSSTTPSFTPSSLISSYDMNQSTPRNGPVFPLQKTVAVSSSGGGGSVSPLCVPVPAPGPAPPSKPSRYRKQQQRAQRGPPLEVQTNILSEGYSNLNGNAGMNPISGTAGAKNTHTSTNTNINVNTNPSVTADVNNAGASDSHISAGAGSFVATVNVQYPAPSTKSVLCNLRASDHCADVIQQLVASRGAELGSDAEDYLLWEVIDVGKGITLRRPLRSTEITDLLLASWPRFANNFGLQLQNSRIRLDTSSLAFLSPRRDILKEPRFNARVSYAQGILPSSSKWTNIVVDITPDGVLTLNRPEATGTSILRALKISDLDVYEGIQGPCTYSLTFRSQLSPDYFADFDEAFHHFSTTSYQTYDALRNICYTLRSQAVEKLSRQIISGTKDSPLFNPPLYPLQSNSHPHSPVHIIQPIPALAVAQPLQASSSSSSASQTQPLQPLPQQALIANSVLPLSNTNMVAGMMFKQSTSSTTTATYIQRRL